MASTPRLPKAEITGPFGYAVKRFARKLLGEVPEPAYVMWHNKQVLRDVMGAGQKAKKWDTVDPDLKSYAQMTVAAMVGCSWCLDYGYFEAQNEQLDLTKASQVPRWRESTVFTPLERDVMEYAEAMTDTPSRVTDELSARLLDALGPSALVELTSWIAFANTATRTNTALGIESQGFSDACEIPLAGRPEPRVTAA